MPLTTTTRGTASAAVARQVGAAQRWKCNACRRPLPAAFQIDHIVPLWSSGEDVVENLQALCANCHADKTQKEAVTRRLHAEQDARREAYETREDVVIATNKVRCSACFATRALGASHPVCWAIERRFSAKVKAAQDAQLRGALGHFSFGR
ncbi:MAG: hypothetical protein CL678_00765 [Bdellovibrionaceae bacterium]|nr:hypothetical protein [Pseudobdellovibrionaceae bacterium]|tara:strand:+ start:6354 stop:6806 length:453 start_codon:yes stop_codon:yes gene_type:complete